MTPYRSDIGPDVWDEWMRATLKGDASAYRQLLEALRPWLLGYFRRRLKGADIDDLVQMTLLSVHEKRHTFDPKAPFRPWVAAVARHKLIDYVRKHSRHVHVEFDEDIPDDRLEPSLAHLDLEILLAQLPPEQARVLRLHKIGEQSVEEVALETGHSQANVKVLVHRAMKKLQSFVLGGDKHV
jgi:RNA polymerase sigma-70 factor, ECF subfamily